jgi:hypothetical protein
MSTSTANCIGNDTKKYDDYRDNTRYWITGILLSFWPAILYWSYNYATQPTILDEGNKQYIKWIPFGLSLVVLPLIIYFFLFKSKYDDNRDYEDSIESGEAFESGDAQKCRCKLYSTDKISNFYWGYGILGALAIIIWGFIMWTSKSKNSGESTKPYDYFNFGKDFKNAVASWFLLGLGVTALAIYVFPQNSNDSDYFKSNDCSDCSQAENTGMIYMIAGLGFLSYLVPYLTATYFSSKNINLNVYYLVMIAISLPLLFSSYTINSAAKENEDCKDV